MGETFTPDKLIAGNGTIVSKGIIVLSGEGSLARGAVLGKVTLGAVSVNALTGKGALTPDATTPLLANAQAGVYKAVCTAAATNSGTFRVYDPKGNVLGDVAVTATFANQIKFAIADGGTDFEVGDTFNITVAAGSGKYRAANSANKDGSSVADCILAEAVDATSADKVAGAYFTGEFSEGALTFGGSDDADDHRDSLRDKGIFLKTTISA